MKAFKIFESEERMTMDEWLSPHKLDELLTNDRHTADADEVGAYIDSLTGEGINIYDTIVGKDVDEKQVVRYVIGAELWGRYGHWLRHKMCDHFGIPEDQKDFIRTCLTDKGYIENFNDTWLYRGFMDREYDKMNGDFYFSEFISQIEPVLKEIGVI